MDIVEFLTARYDEIEHAGRTDSPFAAAMDAAWPGLPECMTLAQAERRTMAALNAVYPYLDAKLMLADIAAKRKIVAEYEDLCERKLKFGESAEGWGARTKLKWICQLLAAPYADHPDFDPAWRTDA